MAVAVEDDLPGAAAAAAPPGVLPLTSGKYILTPNVRSLELDTPTTPSSLRYYHHPQNNPRRACGRIPPKDLPTLADMLTERELQIRPIVQESVMHNTKVRPVPAAPSPACPTQAPILSPPPPSLSDAPGGYLAYPSVRLWTPSPVLSWSCYSCPQTYSSGPLTPLLRPLLTPRANYRLSPPSTI